MYTTKPKSNSYHTYQTLSKILLNAYCKLIIIVFPVTMHMKITYLLMPLIYHWMLVFSNSANDA